MFRSPTIMYMLGEQPSKTPKLTLYTCTIGGAYDGREVIVATPQD